MIDDQWEMLKDPSREQLFVSATVNSAAIQNFAAPTLIDLLILSVSDENNLIDQWCEMEKLVASGKCKNIGLAGVTSEQT